MGSERAHRAAFAVPLAILLFASEAAFAQQQPSASDRETARALMAEGREKRDAGELAAALKAFQTADSIMHVPTTALEVARTQDKMGQLLEARETLLALLRTPPSPSDPPPFAEARKAAEALDADIAKRIPSLTVEATSDLPGPISIVVDDQNVAPNLVGVPRKVNPGKHTVIARAGGEEIRETVILALSENKRVTLRVAKKPPPKPKVEPTPQPGPSQGGEPEPTGAEEKRRVPLVSWIGFGVGGVGLLAGTITGVISISKTNSIEGCVGDECPRGAQDDIDSANTFATISNIGFGVAIAGAAVGLIGLFVLEPAPKRTSSSHVKFVGNGITGTF
jgi:hypothetical protein